MEMAGGFSTASIYEKLTTTIEYIASYNPGISPVSVCGIADMEMTAARPQNRTAPAIHQDNRTTARVETSYRWWGELA